MNSKEEDVKLPSSQPNVAKVSNAPQAKAPASKAAQQVNLAQNAQVPTGAMGVSTAQQKGAKLIDPYRVIDEDEDSMGEDREECMKIDREESDDGDVYTPPKHLMPSLDFVVEKIRHWVDFCIPKVLYKGSTCKFQFEPYKKNVLGKRNTLCVCHTYDEEYWGIFTDIPWTVDGMTKKHKGNTFCFRLYKNEMTKF